jgi:SAM-dependent methyltransferase
MYGFARRYYAALVRRRAAPGGRLLEVGCGHGHLLGLLQDDYRCLGIDVSDFAVEESARNAPRAEIRRMSAGDLDRLERGTFGAVVALHVLEHLPDPEAAVRDVGALLAPGGLFLFATPNPGYWLRRLKDPATDAIGIDPTHINVHPPAYWRACCERQGLAVRRHFGDGLWDVPYLPWVPAGLQLAVFGLPALVQVLTRTTPTPLGMGVNQVVIAAKPG